VPEEEIGKIVAQLEAAQDERVIRRASLQEVHAMHEEYEKAAEQRGAEEDERLNELFRAGGSEGSVLFVVAVNL